MPRKRKSRPIEARYPDALDRERYKSALATQFIEKEGYNGLFSEEQIKAPIETVVDSISYIINDSREASSKVVDIQSMRKIVIDPSFNPVKLSFSPIGTYKTLYFCQKGSINSARRILKKEGIEFPEEHEAEYLAFVKEMTNEAIGGIAKATMHIINSLAQKENIAPKSQEEEKQDQSFVAKLNRNPEEERSGTKGILAKGKKRVSFAPDVASKGDNSGVGL